MYAATPRYEGHIYVEGKGYDLSTPIPIIGWHTDEDGFRWPIHPKTTPEYQAQLDAMQSNRSAWHRATDNWSADDFDRKCDEMHALNTR
jgi:hypothetical protein